MSYVKRNIRPADAEQAAATLPELFTTHASHHAAATEGFRVPSMTPNQAMDAVRTWREAQGVLREGTVYCAGMAIVAGASSTSASSQLGIGRLQLQTELSGYFNGLVRLPAARR